MACLLCRRPSKEDLCWRHVKFYIYDEEHEWFRKKKRLQSNLRRRETNRRFHQTENKLIEILKLIYGSDSVFAAVHPMWAVSPKGALMEYDIAIPSHQVLIEYNGIQHYEWPNYFHRTRKKFDEQVLRDNLKHDLAVDNGWKLIVIKYDVKVDYGTIYELLQEI